MKSLHAGLMKHPYNSEAKSLPYNITQNLNPAHLALLTIVSLNQSTSCVLQKKNNQ